MELLKLELVLKTLCIESSESVYGELEEKLGRGNRCVLWVVLLSM